MRDLRGGIAATAAFLFFIVPAARASNLGYLTAMVLKTMKPYSTTEMPIRTVVIYGAELVRKADVEVPPLQIVEMFHAREDMDVYEELRSIRQKKGALHCVIIAGLAPQHVVDVEQFVRRHPEPRMVIVSTSRYVRTTPLVVEENSLYARKRALDSYGLPVPSTEPVKPIYLDVPRVHPANEPYVRCRPEYKKKVVGRTVEPEEVCYWNAIEQKTRPEKWAKAISDLTLAVLLNPVEKHQNNPHTKAWGVEAYYPRLIRAYFLAHMKRCSAVRRELEFFSTIETELRNELEELCPRRSVMFLDTPLDTVPSQMSGTGSSEQRLAADVEGQSQLLPPRTPYINWSDLATQ